MRVSKLLLKQTLHPPKRTIPLSANPLTRWSCHLPQWRHLGGTLTGVHVGLEGCHSAFNATNSIRTCLFFQTATPPTFLTAPSSQSIEHVQTRLPPSPPQTSSACARSLVEDSPDDNPFEGIARFGEEAFFADSVYGTDCPIIAVENFADRAQSLLRTRLPSSMRSGGIRLVVGHENRGVRRSLLREPKAAEDKADAAAPPVADMVVYVPQYGTISSLNVVTSLGIALFYCYLDAAHPNARVLYPPGCSSAEQRVKDAHNASADDSSGLSHSPLLGQLQLYQELFARELPTPASSDDGKEVRDDASTRSTSTMTALGDAHVNVAPRIDRRPIHPVFYKRGLEDIQRLQGSYRQALLDYSRGASTTSSCEAGITSSDAAPSLFFGISVLYENQHDQRNFGGLIRNANAFLVDRVFYVGRRKVNVVGSVGSYHYTPPAYLGRLSNCEAGSEEAGGTDVDGADEMGLEACSAALHDCVAESFRVGKEDYTPRNWWLLDCGHDFLYTDGSCNEPVVVQAESREDSTAGPSSSAAGDDSSRSSPASLRIYRQLRIAGKVHHLCESEDELRTALAGGVVLLVPQEGKLPHPGLMALCNGILAVLPDGAHFPAHSGVVGSEHSGAVMPGMVACDEGHRGLPSQVASGIALQRLSAVLHPRLAAL